jgi:dTDP-glucose pyrophosphorylase
MQNEHVDKYCAESILEPHTIIRVFGLTEGAACTVLLAENFINDNSELIIANSDQYVEASMTNFIDVMRSQNADAGILTFKSNNPKWSYAKCGLFGRVTEVAEKLVISDQATVGIYYYKHGKDFVRYAKQMIAKNIRVNNEFYVCPVFNEYIADDKRVYIYEISEKKMHGLGTPEDLKKFLKRNWHV